MSLDSNNYKSSDSHLFDDPLAHMDVWALSFLDWKDGVPNLKKILKPDEVERGERFYFLKDREQFILTRGFLRILLGLYLKQSPEALEFNYQEGGKPLLKGNFQEPRLRFNVSHSKGYALLAFGCCGELGVDLEWAGGSRDMEGIAERYFSPREMEEANLLEASQKEFRLYQLWSLKEAVIKGVGEGLGIPLNEVEILRLAERTAKDISFERYERFKSWSARVISPPEEGYAAAVAWQGERDPLRYLRIARGAPPFDRILGSS